MSIPCLPPLQSATDRAYQTSVNCLTSLPLDLFTQIVNKYLFLSETATIPSLSCAAYLQMDTARNERLVFYGTNIKENSKNLALALKQYPKATHLELRTTGIRDKWDSSIYPLEKKVRTEMIQVVADTVKDRQMISLKITGDCGDGETVHNLIQNLKFEKLVHLHLYIQGPAIINEPRLFSGLLAKLADCKELKTFTIYPHWYYKLTQCYDNKATEYHARINALITALPQTVQNLDHHLINSENADLFTQRQDQAPIQECKLWFKSNTQGIDGITPEKLKAFLRFLHLERMTSICLQGTALTDEMIGYIAEQLKKNTTLKVLQLKGLVEDADNLFTRLVEAIGSRELRKLTLSAYGNPIKEVSDDIPKYGDQIIKISDVLLRALKGKFRIWNKLEVFRIGQLVGLHAAKDQIAKMKE